MPVNVALPERVAARRLNLGGISMPVNRRVTVTRRVATDEFRPAFQCR